MPRTVRVILDTIDRNLLLVGKTGALANGVSTTDAADAALVALGATPGPWTPVGDRWPGAHQADVTPGGDVVVAMAAGDVDPAAIVEHLRELDTVEAGAAYLDGFDLDRAALLAVVAASGLTRLGSWSRTKLRERVLQQTITARRKYAGLRKW